MAHLRGPEGCPWDRAQDYQSLKALLLEEAYEVIDAVNSSDFGGLADELGDLLFQVVFFARLAEEQGRFKIDDVIERVHAKLVRRHPHVFGQTRARTPEEALKSWLAVKESERQSPSSLPAQASGEARDLSVLEGFPATLPASLEAYELGVRACEAGFDWPKVEDLLAQIEEETREFRSQAASSRQSTGRNIEEKVGDLLFAVAALARVLRSDPESCLRLANQKFKRRFQTLEREVARQGRRLRDCTPAELIAIWNKIE